MREAVRTRSSGWEIWIASLGCLLGSSLLILAVQLYQDSNRFFNEQVSPSNFFTLNKKIHGGALVNMGKGEKTFTQEELDQIEGMDGVMRTGGFTRNKFPLTLYIWPSGKVGLGAAAKTDLFFESIPDEFLDFVPEEWEWDETPPPCRSSYPSSISIFGISDLHLAGRIPHPVQRSSYWNAHRIIHRQQPGSCHGREVRGLQQAHQQRACPGKLSLSGQRKVWESRCRPVFLPLERRHGGRTSAPLDFLQSLPEEQKDRNASPISSPAEKSRSSRF